MVYVKQCRPGEKGTEVATHLQVPSLLPGIGGLHAIFRSRQGRHATACAGFLSINCFRCGGGDIRNAGR
jgi:hypothetical protein